MSLGLVNLDERTRGFMGEELDDDAAQGRVYISHRLSPEGATDWPELLAAAITSGDDASLARELRIGGRMNSYEPRRTPSGGYTSAKVPVTAPETLAEGEFNRYYMRGLCRRAMEEGVPAVEVYRAKTVSRPRPESQRMLGKKVDPQAMLNDLRTHQGSDTALGLPPGPNSGLSIKLPSA